MNEADKNQNSVENSKNKDQPVMPVIGTVEPLGFITECIDDKGEHSDTNNDEDDNETPDSGSSNEQSSSKRDSV